MHVANHLWYDTYSTYTYVYIYIYTYHTNHMGEMIMGVQLVVFDSTSLRVPGPNGPKSRPTKSRPGGVTSRKSSSWSSGIPMSQSVQSYLSFIDSALSIKHMSQKIPELKKAADDNDRRLRIDSYSPRKRKQHIKHVQGHSCWMIQLKWN